MLELKKEEKGYTLFLVQKKYLMNWYISLNCLLEMGNVKRLEFL